jgi:hypothetical protein
MTGGDFDTREFIKRVAVSHQGGKKMRACSGTLLRLGERALYASPAGEEGKERQATPQWVQNKDS